MKSGWIGRLAKAEMRDGAPFLSYLVTGPELDKVTERIKKAVSDKVESLAKAAKVFLVPSHDTPIALAKSADATTDAGGHLFIEFAVDPLDALAMKVFKGYESGDWCPSVSLGAEKVTRAAVWDASLGKAVTEIVDIDAEQPVHVALCFPGRNVYPLAGCVSAMHKAMRQDPEELRKRGWPEDSLAKAVGGPDGNGWPPPPSFAARWLAQEIQDELPDMMMLLRWTIEDTVSPYTAGTGAEKRALVIQSVNEFLDMVLIEVEGASGAAKAGKTPAEGMGKTGEAETPAPATPAPQATETAAATEGAAAPTPAAETPAAPTETETPAAAGETPAATPAAGEETTDSPAVKALKDELAIVRANLEALQKSVPSSPTVVVLPNATTDPSTAPHAGSGEPTQADADRTKKAIEERLGELRKAIDATRDTSIKAGLIQEHGALLSKLYRMP